MSDISEDEEDFQKIGEDLQIDHLLNIHPELKQINERELEALSRIIRDKYGNIVDDLHKTMPILTKYERTRILGLRTKQINNGSEVFVENNNNIIDGYSLAVLELNQKKIPYIIQRPLPNGGSEYWRVNDLELVDF
jgi:DNA-directed RNA polymerase I, II, and III subunit RPABC2